MDGVRSNSITALTASRSSSSSSMDEPTADFDPSPVHDPSFDILEWHPAHQSCQRYFLDHSQYEHATQAVCALINIRLPFQWLRHAVPGFSAPQTSSVSGPGANWISAGNPSVNNGSAPGPTGGGGGTGTAAAAPAPGSTSSRVNSPHAHRGGANSAPHPPGPPTFVSVVPYLRRLVVTGFDRPGILHGFFGDDWAKGVMPFVECERRNYLFAAKAGGWQSCKKQYDVGSGGGVGGDESVPFMKPLDGASAEELVAAETAWSHWLAMEDWMVGPRAPGSAASARPPPPPQQQQHQQDPGPSVDGVHVDGGGWRRRRTRSNADMADCDIDGYT